ncbi:MAG: hypothetical protein ACP5P7_03905 [Sulfurihydrogenibium sp.]
MSNITKNTKKVNKVRNQTENKTIKALQTLFNPRPKKKIKRIKNKKEVIGSKAYRQDEAIILMEMDNSGKVVDIKPVKTLETAEEIIANSTNNFMFTPNPVIIRRDYWIEYKKAKTPLQRVKLATKYKLLTDDSILNISYIVLDVDSEFEKVYPVWQEFLQKTEIDKGFIVYKTKSGRFHGYVRVSGKFNNGKKVFKHTIKGKAKNGKTHLENVYEIQYIIAAFFEKRGLKIDRSFVRRLNHLIWLEEREINGKKSELYEAKEGEILLYELYNKVKKLQQEEELWTFQGENLTKIHWPKKWKDFEKKGKKQTKQGNNTQQTGTQQTTQQATGTTKQGTKQRNTKPAKLKLKMTNEEKLEEALKSLIKRYKTNRFKFVMLPVCGWAKFLGLDKNFVYDLLRNYLITKSNFDADFEKAWRYSSSLEFVWYENEDLIEKVERFLKTFLGQDALKIYLTRKDLRKLYKTEAEYYQVERYLTDKGYLQTGYRKSGKKGRPTKILQLTQEGVILIQRWIAGENLEDLLENNTGTNNGTGINNTNNTNSNTGSTGNNGNTDPSLENYFTQYITLFYSPLGEQSVDNPISSGDIPYTDGLVGGWKEQNPPLDKPTNQKQPNKPPTIPPKSPTKQRTTQTTKQQRKQTDHQIQPSMTTKTLYGGGLCLKDSGYLKDSGGLKEGGGFRREARIMALLMGYERDQMARAVLGIARCISYFYQKNQANLEEAIYRTFAVYLYLSEKAGGKKVFLPVEVIPRFEEESLQSEEISNIAWGYLERYKEKQEKQKQNQKQKQKRKYKQKSFFDSQTVKKKE